jgi:hypothetical protein
VDIAVASTEEVFDYVEHAMELLIEPADLLGTGELPLPGQGNLILKSHWEDQQ